MRSIADSPSILLPTTPRPSMRARAGVCRCHHTHHIAANAADAHLDSDDRSHGTFWCRSCRTMRIHPAGCHSDDQLRVRVMLCVPLRRSIPTNGSMVCTVRFVTPSTTCQRSYGTDRCNQHLIGHSMVHEVPAIVICDRGMYHERGMQRIARHLLVHGRCPSLVCVLWQRGPCSRARFRRRVLHHT